MKMIFAAMTLLFAGAVHAGGDLPFPFSGDMTKIELAETWDSSKGQQVQIYKDETGETFVLLKDLATGDVEILVKTK